MPKLITASCFMLFWVFYEMSGGADFAPREREVLSQSPFAQPLQTTTAQIDTRPVNAPLVTNASFTPVEVEVLPAVATTTPEVMETIAATPATPPATAAAPEVALFYVSGNWVNMRRGPGTNHPVVDTLPRGTEVELIASNDIGWVRIRLTETNQLGWMAESLLSEG